MLPLLAFDLEDIVYQRRMAHGHYAGPIYIGWPLLGEAISYGINVV
jgi:hypothetical protein